MLRSAALILSGNATAAILLLVRNLLVARLIPVEDYGVAATFAIVMAVVEMASELGLQQQIVQARQGEDPHFQAALQGFQVMRGTLSGLVFFALAGPAATFMGVPEAAWAYRILAFMPLLKALTHFDVWRMSRSMVFWPVILTNAAPPLISVLLIWPLFHLFGDWQVMLWAIFAQMALTPIVSQLVAQRPYRLAFDRQIMAESLRFGWPLLVNGVLLFAVFNGDRIIVGRELGMATLGIFSMGYTLTLTPTLVLGRSAQNFFLPQLSGLDRGDPAAKKKFDRIALIAFETHLVFGTTLVFFVALFAGPAIDLVLGEKFAPVVPLMTLMAILQALRVAKNGPSTVALADGQTGNAMLANIVRVGTLPVAWLLAERTGAATPVLLVGIAGEFLGLCVATALVLRRLDIDLQPLVVPTIVSGIMIGGVAIQTGFFSAATAVVLFCLSLVSMPNLRRYIIAPFRE